MSFDVPRSLDTCGVEPGDWLSCVNVVNRGNWVTTQQEIKLEVMLKAVEICCNCFVHEKVISVMRCSAV